MRIARYPDAAHRSWHEALARSSAPLDFVDPLARQLAHFRDVVRGDAKPLVTARDGLQNLCVVAAIAEAARGGAAVTLPPVSEV